MDGNFGEWVESMGVANGHGYTLFFGSIIPISLFIF